MVEITAIASSSAGNCYRITDGRTPILLECGIPYKQIQQALNFKTTEIKGCLVTHEHNDHAKAVREMARAGINIYATQGTVNSIGADGHRIKIIKPLQEFTVGTWTALPFATQHDAAEPVGFLLASQAGEKVLFATDTYYIHYRFEGLTHIMVECNYDPDILKENIENGIVPQAMARRLLQSHFSLPNVIGFIKANDLTKVKEIWLLHLSASNSDASNFKRQVQEATGKMVYVATE